MKLTETKIKSLPPGKLHCDGNGLYIRLRTSKSGNWSFKYMRGHKSREMGLGPYPEITLQEARLKRDALKIQLAKGSDPLETKRAKAKEHAKARGWYQGETQPFGNIILMRSSASK